MQIQLKPISDQVVVITGASSGIGLTTAEMAAEAGARVILSSRNEADLLEAVTRIRESGGRAFHIVADVADPEAVDAVADLAVEQFGGIDTWVNNAGIGKPASINTQFIEHARSYMDSEPEFIPPVYPPEEAARAILKCAEHPMRDVLVGESAAYLESTAFRQQKRKAANDGIDALYGPQRDGQRRGPTQRHTLKHSALTRLSTSRASRALPFLAFGAIAAGLAFGLGGRRAEDSPE